MKKFVVMVGMFLWCLSATAAETAAVPEPWWWNGYLWVCGVGVAGLGLLARETVKFVYSLVKPWLESKVEQFKYGYVCWKAYLVVEKNFYAHTLRMKEAHENGKLDSEDVEYLRSKFREDLHAELAGFAIEYLKTKGPLWIDELCEWMLGKVKNDVAKAALRPLSALASAPMPELVPGVPGVTGADFGSATN